MCVYRPVLLNINVPNTYLKPKITQNPSDAKKQSSVYDPTYIKVVMLLQEVQIFIQLQKFTPQFWIGKLNVVSAKKS